MSFFFLWILDFGLLGFKMIQAAPSEGSPIVQKLPPRRIFQRAKPTGRPREQQASATGQEVFCDAVIRTVGLGRESPSGGLALCFFDVVDPSQTRSDLAFWFVFCLFLFCFVLFCLKKLFFTHLSVDSEAITS